jgi:hypothetical protein
MLNNFRRNLARLIYDPNLTCTDQSGMDCAPKVAGSSASPQHRSILNFRIYPAANGMILEFIHYHDTKENDVVSYIIPDTENVDEYVKKCLPIELLKASG